MSNHDVLHFHQADIDGLVILFQYHMTIISEWTNLSKNEYRSSTPHTLVDQIMKNSEPKFRRSADPLNSFEEQVTMFARVRYMNCSRSDSLSHISGFQSDCSFNVYNFLW